MNFTHTSLAPDDKHIKMFECPPLSLSLLEKINPSNKRRRAT